MRRGAFTGCVVAVLLIGAGAAGAGATADAQTGSRFRPAKTGQLGVVASESPAAARAARQALERGGNAIDAAATAVFAIGVARPQSCGVGGGGFMVYRSRTGAARALDFRETAPAAYTRDTLSPPGLHKRFTGHLTVGVPGTVAGMASALARYGSITLREAIAPAERLARGGFRVPTSLAIAMKQNAQRLGLFPESRSIFLRPDGTEYPPGSVFRNPDYAASLRRLMRDGPAALYGGELARRIVRDMRAPRPDTKDPGLLTVKDFAAYRAKWRTPIRGTYRNRSIIGMPAPSSGGIAIQQMLNLLGRYDLRAQGQSSATTLHLIAEAQKIAFADRGKYVADPDVVDVPATQLLSSEYAARRAAEIDLGRARAYSPGLGEVAARPEESTTSLSVVDRRGNAAVVTCTIEQEFGSAVVAPGTGFLLNNELTDFGPAGTANEPGPRKRPRSSIAPTIVVEGKRPVMAIGGAGGARIIMGVLEPILQFVDFDEPIDQALDAPRIDATNGTQGRLIVEDGRIPAGVLADLEGRGHRLQREGEYSAAPRVNAAGVVPVRPGFDPARADGRIAAADPRTDDGALAERASP
jgi:gamma-glutamyltranspeptidase/glutathione hydrolase